MLEGWDYATKEVSAAVIAMIEVHERAEDFQDSFKEDTTLTDIHLDIPKMDVKYTWILCK